MAKRMKKPEVRKGKSAGAKFMKAGGPKAKMGKASSTAALHTQKPDLSSIIAKLAGEKKKK